MKRIALYGALALTLILTSCKSEVLEFGKYWGKQVAFDNFMGYNYVPDTLKQTIRFDMGDATKSITLGIFDTFNDDAGNERMNPVVDAIELYANGKRCENHTFKIEPGQNAVELGVVFLPKAQERDYYWVLKVLDAGDADMINDNLTTMEIPILFTWKAEYDTKMNPLALGLLLGGGIILTLLILWLLIIQRIVFPRFKFSDLQIVYMEGDLRKGMQTATLTGARKVVLSSAGGSQSFLSRMFTGRIEFVTHKFWGDEVVISPVDSQCITFEKGASTMYRTKSAMIQSTNNARKPFVVEQTSDNLQALLSIC